MVERAFCCETCCNDADVDDESSIVVRELVCETDADDVSFKTSRNNLVCGWVRSIVLGQEPCFAILRGRGGGGGEVKEESDVSTVDACCGEVGAFCPNLSS